MKLSLRKLIESFLMTILLAEFAHANNCLAKYKCQLDINGTKIKGIKNCTLPAMPTFTITAPDMLDSSGKLKRYFKTNNTVCDVLGWMNEAVPYFKRIKGADVAIANDITLVFKHLSGSPGGDAANDGAIELDTDPFVNFYSFHSSSCGMI